MSSSSSLSSSSSTTPYYNYNSNYIIDLILYNNNPSYNELIQIVICCSIFWTILFAILIKIITKIIVKQKWFIIASKNWYQRHGKEQNLFFGITQTQDEAVELFKYTWPWNQCVCLQHFVSGCLCLPSIINNTSFFQQQQNQELILLSSSLACLGILSEIGWEISDLCIWLYKRFIIPNGNILVPTINLIGITVHHSLCIIIGIPLILYYRHLLLLHQLCFILQAASSIGLFIQEYTKLLNVTKIKQLKQFIILTKISFIVLIITRIILWHYLTYQFIIIWYTDKAYKFLCIGVIMVIIFTIFNWIAFIIPCYKRLIKFQNLLLQPKK